MAKPKNKTTEIRRLSDLKPDPRNANRGSERGTGLIERSLRSYGAGRSILADRNGQIIAGNKTLEGAASAGIERLRVVQTTGHELVVVQRTDLDLEKDKAARELAIADNRAGELSLEWDAAELERQALEFQIDLEGLGIAEHELRDLGAGDATSEVDSSIESRHLGRGARAAAVKVVIAVQKLELIELALSMTANPNRGEALLEICRHYVETEGQLHAAAQGIAAAADA